MEKTKDNTLSGSRGYEVPGSLCPAFFKRALPVMVPLFTLLLLAGSPLWAREDTLGVSPLNRRAAELLFGAKSGVKEVTRVDYDLGIAITTLEKNGTVLAIVDVMSLSEYLARSREGGLREAWADVAKKSISQRQQEYEGGLIPNIELPLKFPGPIEGLIGQGGNLDVRGSQGIQFGGSKHFELEQQQTELTRESPFPELKMKQHLIVNLKGTVGQKVNVFVDHDSERETETKNKIKLQYKGDEDEIVQEIEAGDTDLSLPGTRLIGGPPTHKGLFGIKALAKVGPLGITSIASKEQGQSEEMTISGGAIAETLKIDDIRFFRWRFFQGFNRTADSIVGIRVFVDDGIGSNDDGTIYGEALIDPRNPGDTTEFHSGRFDVKLIAEDFYTFDAQAGVLELVSGLEQNREVLGVSYVTAAGETVGTYKDYYDVTDSVSIQIVKSKVPSPTSITWDYELKNVYSLGVSNLRPPVDLRIRKYSYSAAEDPWTQGDKTFLELLGLDVNPQDGAIDVDRVRWDEGLLVFPTYEPFVSQSLLDPDSIYNRTSFTDYSPKYYIEIVAKGTKTTFNLNAINIMEGSVQVKLNGRELTQGQDYTVDYQSGLVTLLTPEASRPDANVTINYQYAPFLSLASKSLLGTRATYKFSDKANIGTSWMYRSVATKELRPRLGEESSRILVGEVDGHFDAEPYLFTRVADAFPLVSTDAKSSLRLSAEGAVSMPNPSTQGVAFIDDMEGTKTSYSLGMTRPSWFYGSVPAGKDTTNFGDPYWFNPRDGIKAYELDPNLPQTRRNDQVTVLVLGNKHDSTYTDTWVSFNRSLSPGGIDFSKSKALEVWVRGDTTMGRIHIDIGTNIPEDVARRVPIGLASGVRGINGNLDTEDVRTINGELDYDEDVGIDTVAGVDKFVPVPGDDGNDDYSYTPGSDDYSKVNGTENNDRLDTEDLNGNYNLDMRADFFEFTIDLSSGAFLVNPINEYGWRLFRMPLDDIASRTTYGNPDWENITAVRVWIDGFDYPAACTLAGLDIVGNKWRNGGVSGLLPDQGGVFQPEERIEISVKNNERDPDYDPPFDPGDDAYGNKRREQSLVINFFNLESVHRGTAYQIISQKQDYSEYKEIRLWVHGDTSEPTFFVKFGGDERNYYEYRCIATSGWQELILPMHEFTDRKLAHQDENYYFDEGGVGYGFYGKPSFRNIMRLEVGVINHDSTVASGEIWVNEVRVTDPRKDTGTAGRVSLNTTFADLMGFNVDLSRVDSEFHGLTSERGSGQTRTSISGTGNMSMGKFLPEKWGLSIPLTGSVVSEVSLPKYQQSSDIVLTGDEASKRASHATRRGANVSLSKTKPSLNKLMKWTIDNLQVSSSLSQNFSDSETRIDSSAAYEARATYSYAPQLKPLSVFGLFGLAYFPKSFNFSSGYNRNWQAGYVRSDTSAVRTTTDENKTASGGAGFTYDPITFVTTNYAIDAVRDLNLPGDVLGASLGSEVRRSQNAGIGFQLPIFKDYINQSANYDTRYLEDHDPDIGGTENDYRNVTNASTATTSATLNLAKFASLLSRPGAVEGDSAGAEPNWFLSQVVKLTGRITSPKASYTRNRSSRYSFLKERPTWEYQFGLRDDLGDIEKDYYALDENSESDNYQANSGLTFGELAFNVSVRGTDSWKDYRGAKTRSHSLTWPDLSATLRSFERFLPMKRLVQSSELRSSYAVVNSDAGPFGEPATSRSVSNSFSPLLAWRTSWQKRINSEISTNYSRTEKESGTPVTTDTETRKGASATVSYSFSAPGGLKLPFIGSRIKFKSNLDLSLTGSYNSTYSELVTEGSDKPPRTNADSESFSISSRANYNFSRSVSGGMRVEFAQNKDKQRGRTGRDINVEFDVLFKF
jgi:hypothetical protein